MIAPSESRMISVGSSSPRLGSISKPRKPAKHGGNAKHRGQLASQAFNTDIIGDVPLEFGRGQPERAVFLRQIAACVVGEQHEAPRLVAIDEMKGRERHSMKHFQDESSLFFVFPGCGVNATNILLSHCCQNFAFKRLAR